MKITEIKPGKPATWEKTQVVKIFLAGTIDMGNSDDWQKIIVKNLADAFSKNESLLLESNIVVFNPRRDTNDAKVFYENMGENYDAVRYQIMWEQERLDEADIIFMNILPDSYSPITLMELGLYANSGKLIVCCPEKFYRFCNVEITCNKYNIPLYTTLEEGYAQLCKKILRLK